LDDEELAVERLDINKDIWDYISSLSNKRAKFASVVLPNNNILILGGKQV
jgi:hypothetical protein